MRNSPPLPRRIERALSQLVPANCGRSTSLTWPLWSSTYLLMVATNIVSGSASMGLTAPKKTDPATSARPCECVQRKGVQSAGRLDNSLAVCCA
jgi:hypothetical protein